jgi:hypothetical protein
MERSTFLTVMLAFSVEALLLLGGFYNLAILFLVITGVVSWIYVGWKTLFFFGIVLVVIHPHFSESSLYITLITLFGIFITMGQQYKHDKYQKLARRLFSAHFGGEADEINIIPGKKSQISVLGHSIPGKTIQVKIKQKETLYTVLIDTKNGFLYLEERVTESANSIQIPVERDH